MTYSDSTMARIDAALKRNTPKPITPPEEEPIPSFSETCCGKCYGACYVDFMTGA